MSVLRLPASVPPALITVGTSMIAIGGTDEVAVVHIAGEVDMTTLPVARAELVRAVTGDSVAVVIDLNSVSFLGCAGVQMLVEARDMARACQVGLHLAVRGRAVLRPIEVIGLMEAFLVHPSVTAASAALEVGGDTIVCGKTQGDEPGHDQSGHRGHRRLVLGQPRPVLGDGARTAARGPVAGAEPGGRRSGGDAGRRECDQRSGRAGLPGSSAPTVGPW